MSTFVTTLWAIMLLPVFFPINIAVVSNTVWITDQLNNSFVLTSGVPAFSMSTTCSENNLKKQHQPISSWRLISRNWQMIGIKREKSLRLVMRRNRLTFLMSMCDWWTCGRLWTTFGDSLMRWNLQLRGICNIHDCKQLQIFTRFKFDHFGIHHFLKFINLFLRN